jgi:uncharacterized membrane protein (UPF0182 family)
MENGFSNSKAFNNGLKKFAGRQLAIVLSLSMLFISLGYLLKSFKLVYSPRGVVFGASHTDIHVSLLFYKIIMIVSIIGAIIIFN